MPLRYALSRLRHFLRDSRGSVSAEAVLVLPIVLWAYLATFQYYDAFGTIARNMKATYTLADLISRQTQTVTPAYINGLTNLYSYLNHNPPGVWTRVTTVGWDPNAGASGQYYVQWSYATNSNPALTDTTLQSYIGRLPTITGGDTLIVVETHMTYVPSFDIVGMQTQTYNQLVVTRPRISAQVAWDATGGSS